PVLLDVQLQQLVAAVVADDELGADAMMGGRPERLDRVHAPAVAGEADDGPVWVSQLGPDRTRDADPERAAPRLVVTTRLVRREVRGEAGRAGQRLVEDHALRAQPLRELTHEPGGAHGRLVPGGRVSRPRLLVLIVSARASCRPPRGSTGQIVPAHRRLQGR